MVKINYKLWKRTFPYVCIECDNFAYRKTYICERCGRKETLRKTNKKDYKRIE